VPLGGWGSSGAVILEGEINRIWKEDNGFESQALNSFTCGGTWFQSWSELVNRGCLLPLSPIRFNQFVLIKKIIKYLVKSSKSFLIWYLFELSAAV
jgi:hypothetical protein